MSFARLHKLVAYVLSGLGLFGLSLGGELTLSSTVLIGIGYVASFFAEGPWTTSPRYASWWTGAVVFALAVQVLRAVVDGPTLALAIEFAAFLQISRLFLRRTGVDYQQIAVLAFVHLVAATVLSTSLSYGLMFVGFVIATPWMLALSHLRREIESNYTPDENPTPEALLAMRRVLASKRVVGPRFLLGTAMLSLPLFAMTLSIFVVIPRVGKGFLSFRRDAGQQVAGFGDHVELGGFGVIRDDPTVVLRVTPLPAVDERAPRLSLRLRGTSFDHYDGKRWGRSPGAIKRLRSQVDDLYLLSRPPMQGSDQQMQIVLEHLDEPVMFLPEGSVAIDVPPKVERGERFARRLHYESGHDVRYDADGVGLVYKVWVSRMSDEHAIRPLLPETRKTYKQVPRGHERIAELARSVVGDAQTTEEKALRVLRYLNNGNLRYSLDQPLVEDKPPLEVFLFDEKRGHCEYFSSAMAIMLRTQGVATRNVTGFVGGRYNPYGGYYALRQGDAHSWVEVWVKGRGWVTYDPTPPSRAAIGPRTGIWSDVNAFIDALRTRWMTSVVGYDLRAQVGLLRQVRQLLAQYKPSGMSFDTSVDDDASLSALRGRLGRVLFGVLGVGLLLLAGYLIWRRGRGGERARARADALIVRLYRELDLALQKQGHPRSAASTPLEHARELRARGVPYCDDVQRVTDCYVSSRYGEHIPTPEELAELREAVARVRASDAQPPSDSRAAAR